MENSPGLIQFYVQAPVVLFLLSRMTIKPRVNLRFHKAFVTYQKDFFVVKVGKQNTCF